MTSHSTKGVCRAVGCAESPGRKGLWGLCGAQVLSKSQRMVEMDDADSAMWGLLPLSWVPPCGSGCDGVTGYTSTLPAQCEVNQPERTNLGLL